MLCSYWQRVSGSLWETGSIYWEVPVWYVTVPDATYYVTFDNVVSCEVNPEPGTKTWHENHTARYLPQFPVHALNPQDENILVKISGTPVFDQLVRVRVLVYYNILSTLSAYSAKALSSQKLLFIPRAPYNTYDFCPTRSFCLMYPIGIRKYCAPEVQVLLLSFSI